MRSRVRRNATTGWAIAAALPDQISTLNTFDHTYGKPKTTVAWGHSPRRHHHGRAAAGLTRAGSAPRWPMCGVLAGGVATWNTALDGAFAFATLIDPSIQVTGNHQPHGQPAKTPRRRWPRRSRPRRAGPGWFLAAALGDTPGWFTPAVRRTAATDYAAQEANQYLWFTEVTFPFIFAFRAGPGGLKAGGEPVLEYRRELRQRPGEVRRP